MFSSSGSEQEKETNGGNGSTETHAGPQVKAGEDSAETHAGPQVKAGEDSAPGPASITAADPREAQGENWPERPKERIVIQAKVISQPLFPEDSEEVKILAQPSPGNDQCTFKVNRPLTEGFSWHFANFESAAGSPLAEALFSLDEIETVLLLESTLTITRKDKTIVDWKPLAEEVGKVVRGVLAEGGTLIDPHIPAELPGEAAIREEIQAVIDTEVNPGVAAHGGRITLLGVKGNTITIQMGGGCQGCSAADLTLKQGIHTAFRKSVPKVGAILDETDHSAGLNPYFS